MLFDEQKTSDAEGDDLRILGEKLGDAAEKVSEAWVYQTCLKTNAIFC